MKHKERKQSFEDDDDDFEYKPRSKGDWESSANQSGGNYDSMYKEGIRPFKAREGENRVRVLPPTWDGAKGFSFIVFQHSRIGPDQQSYLCPEANQKGTCPICEERRRIEPDIKQDDKEGREYLFKLRPVKRAAMYLIDRNSEADGPKMWVAPWKVDRGFSAAARDPETREYAEIDHPKEGVDMFFQRAGSQDRTEYSDYRISRSPSRVSDDPAKYKAWLKWVIAHPIPDMLVWHSEEKIRKAFRGKSSKDEDAGGDSDEQETKHRKKDLLDDIDEDFETEEKPKVKKIKKKVKKHKSKDE